MEHKPLNYIPIFAKAHQGAVFQGFIRSLKRLWSFLWRWALLYIPVWALLMGFYFRLK